MANQKMKTKPLNKERFKEARKLRGMSLAVLASHSSINRTEKTLLRWISQKEMPVDLLDTIGKVLNVDPEYISGTYDRRAEELESDPTALKELKSQLHASDFPYLYKQKRDLEPLQYVRELMIENDIEPEQLDQLSLREQIQVFIELERATSAVLEKHFKPHRSSLHTYSMPMPPEDEIIHM